MKKLLVVVDVQNDFVDGALGFSGAENIVPYIIGMIEQYEREGQTIVFTRDFHQDDYLDSVEGHHLPISHCVRGTKGARFYGELEAISNNHIVFEKPTFGSSELFDYVRNHPFDEIRLLGLVSHICVFTNAVLIKTALPNAHIIVDSKGSGSGNLEMQNKGYEILKNLHIDIF